MDKVAKAMYKDVALQCAREAHSCKQKGRYKLAACWVKASFMLAERIMKGEGK